MPLPARSLIFGRCCGGTRWCGGTKRWGLVTAGWLYLGTSRAKFTGRCFVKQCVFGVQGLIIFASWSTERG